MEVPSVVVTLLPPSAMMPPSTSGSGPSQPEAWREAWGGGMVDGASWGGRIPTSWARVRCTARMI
jgi:hypothetical protein